MFMTHPKHKWSCDRIPKSLRPGTEILMRRWLIASKWIIFVITGKLMGYVTWLCSAGKVSIPLESDPKFCRHDKRRNDFKVMLLPSACAAAHLVPTTSSAPLLWVVETKLRNLIVSDIHVHGMDGRMFTDFHLKHYYKNEVLFSKLRL
jgi:hypothetical protein